MISHYLVYIKQNSSLFEDVIIVVSSAILHSITFFPSYKHLGLKTLPAMQGVLILNSNPYPSGNISLQFHRCQKISYSRESRHLGLLITWIKIRSFREFWTWNLNYYRAALASTVSMTSPFDKENTFHTWRKVDIEVRAT